MDKIKLKRLWTDVAKGKISKKDAELLIKPKKTQPRARIKGSEKGLKRVSKNTHKRKGLTKSREVK